MNIHTKNRKSIIGISIMASVFVLGTFAIPSQNAKGDLFSTDKLGDIVTILTKLNLMQPDRCKDPPAPNVDWSGCDMSGADFRNVDISNADLRSTDFSGAKLNGAIMTGANMKETNFSGADLTGADLSNADA